MSSKPGIWVVLGVALWAAPWAAAQSVAPAAVDALERALQQADGPKRRILEAARLKPSAPTPPPSQRARAEGGAVSPVLGSLVAPAALPLPTPAMSSVPMLPPAELPPAPAPLADLQEPLVLLSLVEPAVPPRWLRRTLELTVELVVQADGSVDRVAVGAGAPAVVVERVVEAVRQWRYAPLPAARAHRVTLVFRPA